MSDNFDDADVNSGERITDQASLGGDVDLFGDFSVLAPGVQIILDGRPVSHSGR